MPSRLGLVKNQEDIYVLREGYLENRRARFTQ